MAEKKTQQQTVEELSLMLMYLTRIQDNNECSPYMETAWKGYDLCTLNQLEEQKLIIQPPKSHFAYLTEKGKEQARLLLKEYQLSDRELWEKFEFRNIRPEEAIEAAKAEAVCFPPNEACSKEMMSSRAVKAPELFLVAAERKTGKIAGFLTGLSTDESAFRDEFFTNAELHNPNGRNVMLLSLAVLPEYRNHGLARELMYHYLRRERENGREVIFLTCLPSKIEMYTKMGFHDLGISNSSWGGEQWHEMSCTLNIQSV